VGVWIFYLLVRRWVQPWAAFGAALLFLLQPLFWGHAFINPKDIPYLVVLWPAFIWDSAWWT